MLAHGASPAGQDTDDESPLALAALHGFDEVVKALLDRGADANPPGRSPLLCAAAGGRITVSDVLIQHIDSANARTRRGLLSMLPTTPGEARRYASIVRYLLVNGARANAVDADSDTAPHHAVVQGSVEMVQALIAYGADLGIAGFQGTTPLTVAQAYGRDEIAPMLRHAGANR